MKRALKTIIILGILTVLIVGTLLVRAIVKKSQIIPPNAPNTIGNTAGNLYNGGLFCEHDGIVYFANAYDNGSLYAMNPDQSNIVKITSGDISFINAGGNYLYYYSESAANQTGLGYVRNGRAIYRTDISGQTTVLLTRSTTDGMMLVNDTLYYVNFAEDDTQRDTALVTLASITTNGDNPATIAEIHPKIGCCQNGSIYYGNTTRDHYLYELDTATNNVSLFLEIEMYQPIIQNDIIYYMDIADDYLLKAYSLSDQSITTIVDERVDAFNLSGSIIYYQNCNPEDYALKRIGIDGTNEELVKSGVYTNISITSDYVYFTEFGNDLPVYQTPTTGDIMISNFSAAFDAAVNND